VDQHDLAAAATALELKSYPDRLHAGLARSPAVALVLIHVAAPQAHIAVIAVGGTHLGIHHHLLPAVTAFEPAAMLTDTLSDAFTLKVGAFALVMTFHPYSPTKKTSSRLAALDRKGLLNYFVRAFIAVQIPASRK
jgi:hypothetical protein